MHGAQSVLVPVPLPLSSGDGRRGRILMSLPRFWWGPAAFWEVSPRSQGFGMRRRRRQEPPAVVGLEEGGGRSPCPTEPLARRRVPQGRPQGVHRGQVHGATLRAEKRPR